MVEFTIPEHSRSDLAKQIVRETDQKKNEKPKYDFKPRFFSDTTKYTEQEMRAANSGMTQNRSAQVNRPSPTNQGQRSAPKDPDGYLPQGQSANLPPARRMLPTPGVSSVGETLPDDIKVGEWTSLNTERYLFYTFYARIEERVRFHWERAIRDAAQYIPPKKLTERSWVTNIEIILDDKGHFERAILHGKSGIDGFDQAATNAFRIGSPFLNPPKELVQDDNKLHLKYQITVFYAPPNARM